MITCVYYKNIENRSEEDFRGLHTTKEAKKSRKNEDSEWEVLESFKVENSTRHVD